LLTGVENSTLFFEKRDTNSETVMPNYISSPKNGLLFEKEDRTTKWKHRPRWLLKQKDKYLSRVISKKRGRNAAPGEIKNLSVHPVPSDIVRAARYRRGDCRVCAGPAPTISLTRRAAPPYNGIQRTNRFRGESGRGYQEDDRYPRGGP
jgi:hypothetical protein